MIRPYYEKLQNISGEMYNGNFGLWYNKFIPLNDHYKPSANSGNDQDNIKYYQKEYDNFKKTDGLQAFLNRKHLEYHNLIEYYTSINAACFTFTASLISPLIIGIGETHPSETSLIFNYNLGIPYIPASSIRGIIRFAYTLDLLKNIPSDKLKSDKDKNIYYFDDEDSWTKIALYFGTMKERGSVLFLDSYPINVPELKVDIMNPHYGKYYSENKAPADYLLPKPIKFLVVQEGVKFIFHFIITNEASVKVIKGNLKNSLYRALFKEGIGAKTALGYGRFEILSEGEPDEIENIIRQEELKRQQKRLEKEKERIASLSPEELILDEIEKLGNISKTGNIAQQIGDLWSKIKRENIKEREIFLRLKEKLIQLNEWEPRGNKKKKEKILKRQKEITGKLDA